MSRFLGYAKKLNRRIIKLERDSGGGNLADVMRHYAETGEYPNDPALRDLLVRHQEIALAMFNTVHRCPTPEPEPMEKPFEQPLSETFTDDCAEGEPVPGSLGRALVH